MINVDELTVGQIKEIAKLAGGIVSNNIVATEGKINIANDFLGKFCIARCYSAGVHVGLVSSVDGENVVLKESIRLWSWKAKDGLALSGVANNGIDKSKSKIDTINDLIYLTGVCELIPVSVKAKESIYGK